jgi:uncharacterized protein YbjT (DUF2867 family)
MKTTEQETILITGATGNVGREVIKQLSSASTDINIKAAVHSAENAKKVVKEYDRVEVVLIDYNKPETLKEALKDVDKLFFVPPDVPNAIEHASNMITEAKNAGIRHIVKLSALGADMESVVASLRLHRQAEKIIEESGIPYTFLRPGEFMQNFVNWFSQTIKKEGTFWRVGDTRVSFVDVRDIAAVAVQALINNNDDRHNSKAYTITGPEALSYYQVAEILSNATGKKIDYVNISKEEARRQLENSVLSDWWINVIVEVFDLYRGGTQAQVSSAVEEVTGRKPITFAQFAKDYAEAFR